jgi:hypothetical protein
VRVCIPQQHESQTFLPEGVLVQARRTFEQEPWLLQGRKGAYATGLEADTWLCRLREGSRHLW